MARGKPIKVKRPSFSSIKKKASRLEATLSTGKIHYMSVNLSDKDLAAPHRAPYAAIRNLIFTQKATRVEKSIRILLGASRIYEGAFEKSIKKDRRYGTLRSYYESTRKKVEVKLEEYKKTPNDSVKTSLLQAVNNLASNAPGLGPHSSINIPVSDRLHLHMTGRSDEPMTPRSKAALSAFPEVPIATKLVGKEERVVSVTGEISHSVSSIGLHPTQIIRTGIVSVLEGSLKSTEKGSIYL